MRNFMTRLGRTLADIFTSKKVVTAVATGIAAAVIKDPAIRDNTVKVGLLLLGGQAAADFGKEAKKVEKRPPQ